MKIYKIVENWLKKNGHNSLSKPDTECSCGLEDLMMCETYNRECEVKNGNIKVYEIVERWLKENGYDGLYKEGTSCYCKYYNLMMCQRHNRECEPGYLHTKEIITWMKPQINKKGEEQCFYQENL